MLLFILSSQNVQFRRINNQKKFVPFNYILEGANQQSGKVRRDGGTRVCDDGGDQRHEGHYSALAFIHTCETTLSLTCYTENLKHVQVQSSHTHSWKCSQYSQLKFSVQTEVISVESWLRRVTL